MKDRWYIVIQAYMVEDLKLSGVELMVFAAIRGFSAPGGQGYVGSLKTLAKMCSCEERQCKRVLEKLVDKKLITKEERPGWPSKFTACFEPEQIEMFSEEETQSSESKENEPKKERADCYKEYRDIYLEKYKELGFKDPPQLQSALINTRLKTYIKDKNVTPQEFKECLDLISKNEFAMNSLQFEFQKILSYNIFNNVLARVRNKTAGHGELENVVIESSKCPICGSFDNKTIFGTCGYCFPDDWKREMALITGGKY